MTDSGNFLLRWPHTHNAGTSHSDPNRQLHENSNRTDNSMCRMSAVYFLFIVCFSVRYRLRLRVFLCSVLFISANPVFLYICSYNPKRTLPYAQNKQDCIHSKSIREKSHFPKATASLQGYGAAVNIPSEVHIITQHAGLKTFMFRLLYIFFKNIG